MKKIYTITIPPTTGKELICNATGFTYIDSDFKNWGLDKEEQPKEEMKFDVMQLTEDMTFKQMFTNFEKMVMTQEQILACEKQNTESITNFYLIQKNDGEYYVVHAYNPASGRGVGVHRFDSCHVWLAVGTYRLVVPQHVPETLGTSDTQTLVPFVPHAPTMQVVKKYCKCEQCVEFYNQWKDSE